MIHTVALTPTPTLTLILTLTLTLTLTVLTTSLASMKSIISAYITINTALLKLQVVTSLLAVLVLKCVWDLIRLVGVKVD
jgi:hypothetical protein